MNIRGKKGLTDWSAVEHRFALIGSRLTLAF